MVFEIFENLYYNILLIYRIMVDIDKLKTFSIIGAGHMGHEIAEVFLMAGFEKVILNDLKMELIETAITKIKNGLKKTRY